MTTTRHYGFRSLRFKLALGCVAIEAIMLTILVWNSMRITDNALYEIFQNRVTTITPMLNSSLASPLVQRDYAVLNERLEHIVDRNSLVYLEVRDELGALRQRDEAASATVRAMVECSAPNAITSRKS